MFKTSSRTVWVVLQKVNSSPKKGKFITIFLLLDDKCVLSMQNLLNSPHNLNEFIDYYVKFIV